MPIRKKKVNSTKGELNGLGASPPRARGWRNACLPQLVPLANARVNVAAKIDVRNGFSPEHRVIALDRISDVLFVDDSAEYLSGQDDDRTLRILLTQ